MEAYKPSEEVLELHDCLKSMEEAAERLKVAFELKRLGSRDGDILQHMYQSVYKDTFLLLTDFLKSCLNTPYNLASMPKEECLCNQQFAEMLVLKNKREQEQIRLGTQYKIDNYLL